MLTQCPGCQTVFRVTGAILRAAHGQVRCGKCGQQFDAIAYLLDQDEPSEATTGVEITESPPEETSGLPGISHEDIILEGHRIEISGIYDRLSPEDGKPLMAHGHIIEEFSIGNEQWENPFANAGAAADESAEQPVDLDAHPADGDDAPVTEVEDIEAELNAVELAEDINSLDPDPGLETGEHITIEAPASAGEIDAKPTTPDHASAETGGAFASPPRNSTAEVLTPDEALLSARPARRWTWRVASFAMIALLTMQAVHHWRTTLARHPGIGPVLVRAYNMLGQTLTPEWQLAAYRVKQWGIVSDPAQPGTLRVRASVTNEAPFAQPYPVLRLILEDRFGARVGQRDFVAREYLNVAPSPDRLLDSAAAANVDLTLVDPGADAVGFQLDSCLPQTNGLVCTHDPLSGP